MKKVCHFWGIKAPAYVLANNSADIDLAAKTLHFPLITKHPNSYSSIGLTKESRVETPSALRKQAERMIEAFGATLIEEFIEGREFSVLVVENADDEFQLFAYRPVEFIFPNGETFKHFLVPVWLLVYTYHGKPYRVLVNGVSGAIDGNYPSEAVVGALRAAQDGQEYGGCKQALTQASLRVGRP